jgi:hypothetical protein
LVAVAEPAPVHLMMLLLRPNYQRLRPVAPPFDRKLGLYWRRWTDSAKASRRASMRRKRSDSCAKMPCGDLRSPRVADRLRKTTDMQP